MFVDLHIFLGSGRIWLLATSSMWRPPAFLDFESFLSSSKLDARLSPFGTTLSLHLSYFFLSREAGISFIPSRETKTISLCQDQLTNDLNSVCNPLPSKLNIITGLGIKMWTSSQRLWLCLLPISLPSISHPKELEA